MVTKLTPAELAEELLNENVSLEHYQEIQDRRKERLTLWKARNIQALIKAEQELVDYGEEVIKFMKEDNGL